MSLLPYVESRHRPSRRIIPARGAWLGWVVTLLLAVVAIGVLALGVGPRFLPYRAYAIQTGSMSPALPIGAEAILRPARADDLAVGDVIAFHKPGNLTEVITHRIVRVETVHGERRFVTKGDANSVPDAWRIRVQGSGWREVASIPYAGYVVEALRSPLPRLAVIALLVLWFGITGLRRIWATPSKRTDLSVER